MTDDYCLAMNGTVENAVALRSALNLLPYPDSDGAVLAALLQAYADSGTVAALRLCCREARGNYAWPCCVGVRNACLPALTGRRCTRQWAAAALAFLRIWRHWNRIK